MTDGMQKPLQKEQISDFISFTVCRQGLIPFMLNLKKKYLNCLNIAYSQKWNAGIQPVHKK